MQVKAGGTCILLCLFISRKRVSMGDDLKANGFKVTKLGNTELTRLWNLCPDNMAACASHSRLYDNLFLDVAVEYMTFFDGMLSIKNGSLF
jgi:hypothetical protein